MNYLRVYWIITLILFLILLTAEILAGVLWYAPADDHNRTGSCQVMACNSSILSDGSQIISTQYVLLTILDTNVSYQGIYNDGYNPPVVIDAVCKVNSKISCYYNNRDINGTLTLHSNEYEKGDALLFMALIGPFLFASFVLFCVVSLCCFFYSDDQTNSENIENQPSERSYYRQGYQSNNQANHRQNHQQTSNKDGSMELPPYYVNNQQYPVDDCQPQQPNNHHHHPSSNDHCHSTTDHTPVDSSCHHSSV